MQIRKLLSRLFAAAALVFVALAPTLALAQAPFPTKQVSIVVAFPPGGGADLLGRLLAKKYQEMWGQTVVVLNRPGAAGVIGAKEVARAAPDGHTLLVGASGAVMSANEAELAPVALLSTPPYIVAVNAATPVNTLRELVAYAKARPDGSVSFASSGSGSASHLAGEQFQTLTQTKLTHVPYKGQGQAVQDLVGGQVTVMFGPPPALLPHIKSGKLRALAVSSPKRIALLPDVPTVAESGVPGTKDFEADQWYGVVAPAGTPADIVAMLNRQINQSLNTPDVHARLTAEGAEPTPTTPQAFGQLIASEMKRWDRVIKSAHITVD
jgi:tripartite-type tricarboxylate transporter receptor subunit TctC